VTYLEITRALVAARHSQGMSSRQLADNLNIQTARMSRLENGGQIPSAAFLVRWAGALGCQVLVVQRA